METTDPFSARAAVIGVIVLAIVGAVGTVWLYLTGHGSEAREFGVTILAVSAPVAALARITRAGPVVAAEAPPAAPTGLNGPDPAVGH
jgi:hypothetical protein